MNGFPSPGRYQPSFPRNDQPRPEQPHPALSALTSQRYQPTFPQTNNHLPLNQLAYDQPYNYSSYINQPLNYNPSSLLSAGPSLSTLNPSAGLLSGYPTSLRGENSVQICLQIRHCKPPHSSRSSPHSPYNYNVQYYFFS